jgi:hypothetical protein
VTPIRIRTTFPEQAGWILTVSPPDHYSQRATRLHRSQSYPAFPPPTFELTLLCVFSTNDTRIPDEVLTYDNNDSTEAAVLGDAVRPRSAGYYSLSLWSHIISCDPTEVRYSGPITGQHWRFVSRVVCRVPDLWGVGVGNRGRQPEKEREDSFTVLVGLVEMSNMIFT